MTNQWSPRGYQKLANLMGSHQETAIFRSFGELTMLNLLNLQAEVIDIEVQLREACREDDQSAQNPTTKLFSVDFYTLHHAGKQSTQMKLLEESRKKLQVYHALLLQAAGVAQLKAPKKPDLRFLQDWLGGSREGANFLQGRERQTWNDSNLRDYVTLLNPEETSDSVAKWLNPRLIDWYHRVWGGRRMHAKEIDTENSGVIDYSDSKAIKSSEIVSQLALTTITSLFPALSILWLYHVKSTVVRIGITIGLSTLLGIILRFVTNANMKEIFGATAAFAAVEVVFIGSANGTSS